MNGADSLHSGLAAGAAARAPPGPHGRGRPALSDVVARIKNRLRDDCLAQARRRREQLLAEARGGHQQHQQQHEQHHEQHHEVQGTPPQAQQQHGGGATARGAAALMAQDLQSVLGAPHAMRRLLREEAQRMEAEWRSGQQLGAQGQGQGQQCGAHGGLAPDAPPQGEPVVLAPPPLQQELGRSPAPRQQQQQSQQSQETPGPPLRRPKPHVLQSQPLQQSLQAGPGPGGAAAMCMPPPAPPTAAFDPCSYQTPPPGPQPPVAHGAGGSQPCWGATPTPPGRGRGAGDDDGWDPTAFDPTGDVDPDEVEEEAAAAGQGQGGGGPWSDADVAAAAAEVTAALYAAIAEELQALDDAEAAYWAQRAEQEAAEAAAAGGGEGDGDGMAVDAVWAPGGGPLTPSSSAAPGGPGGPEPVLCPVCCGCALVELHGVVACPAERWQLDGRADGLGLPQLRQQLACLFEEHHATGCRGALRFWIDAATGTATATGGSAGLDLGAGPGQGAGRPGGAAQRAAAAAAATAALMAGCGVGPSLMCGCDACGVLSVVL